MSATPRSATTDDSPDLPERHAVIPAMPQVSARVSHLVGEMTLEEKLAQLVGYWLDQGGNVVAPMQGEFAEDQAGTELAEVTRHGIGHYTRVYGTRPVDAAQRAAWLWAEQHRLRTSTRLGIPALVHEECLTGLAAWGATTYPTPLAWGASFDPDLVRTMAHAIGTTMHTLGVHQGLAPVLDVIRDPRWGRVDECIGEDPYLVGSVGTAFVQGLQSAGVHATLKHFLGYSASQAGRNHAPVHVGPREVSDVFLPPFEMAILDGGAWSVMNAYVDLDGIPMAANTDYLTTVLRERLGFTGVVVADYFAVAFLQLMHGIAADRGEAAELALTAGLDVELPSGDAYLGPLAERVRSGALSEAWVDRAALRVLNQKEALGLLDAVDATVPPATIDLDPPEQQDIARRLAAESIVLLRNDAVLPLAPTVRRIAVVGPNADRAEALQGCYSFANHVLAGYPDLEAGIAAPTVREALASALAERPDVTLTSVAGCGVEDADESGFEAAVDAAAQADVVVFVGGDQAGLFGRGTVGEGNDADSLELPGVQRHLIEALVRTGTPVVVVLLTGRPYAIGWALDTSDGPAAVLQAFFPGEGGGLAIADVLTGRTNPSGRLPVSLPRSAGAEPFSYLHPVLAGPTEVTSVDPTPVRPFGFGLSYTSFDYGDLLADPTVGADGHFHASVSVTNTGPVPGCEVVQLYAHDVRASVVRPVSQLIGYARVDLDPGRAKRVTFTVPTSRLALTDRRLVRVVEPGDFEVWAGSHALAHSEGPDGAAAATGPIESQVTLAHHLLPGVATPRFLLRVTGPVHEVTRADDRLVRVRVDDA